MASYTLGKTARLKHRKQIDSLFKSGKTCMVFPYRIYYQEKAKPVDPSSPVQFGVGVSKRYFKKAVDRNHIKRLTREVYRVRQLELKSLIIEKGSGLDLFFIFTGKELPVFSQCEEAMAKGLHKVSHLLLPKK